MMPGILLREQQIGEIVFQIQIPKNTQKYALKRFFVTVRHKTSPIRKLFPYGVTCAKNWS